VSERRHREPLPLGGEDGLPFSKGLLARALIATGVSPDRAYELALAADGDQTILVIEVRGMPLDKIAFYGAGWQIHAEDLAAYLSPAVSAATARRGGTSLSPRIRTWRPTSASDVVLSFLVTSESSLSQFGVRAAGWRPGALCWGDGR